MFSDWGYTNFFITNFLQVLDFPSTAAVKKKFLKRDCWEVSFLNLLFHSLGITTQFLFKSCIGDIFKKATTEFKEFVKENEYQK